MFFYIVFPVIDRENPIAKTLALLDKDKTIIAYRIYNPAYSFYIRKPFPEFKTTEELRDYLESSGDGYLITRTTFASELEELTQLNRIAEAKDIFEIPTTLIYRIEAKWLILPEKYQQQKGQYTEDKPEHEDEVSHA